MRKPESPCAKCMDRTLKCHSSCRKYIIFQEQNRIYSQLIEANAGRDDRVKYCRSRLRRMYK